MTWLFWGEFGLAVAILLGIFRLTAWALDRLEDHRAEMAEREAWLEEYAKWREDVLSERRLRIVSRTGARR